MTRPFDVCGPLPSGVTVLEASAGTGKTYTIAALATRYVADGIPLDELLLVTFTRMATSELRERVRERLVSAEQALTRALAGAPPEDDPLLRLLASGDVRARRDRLARALADFDAATIATTHGFCQEVLASLGVAGDAARDEQFLEDVSDLREEVVDDLYVRRFHGHDGRPPFDRREAGAIAAIAVDNPTAPIEPRAAADASVPAMRERLARAVRNELADRKAAAGILTYDDLVTRLADALRRPAVVAALRRRYRVVLVDEFQDTDPVQWDILRRAFGRGTLVLVGDPKQAIYAFRGADVYAYLEAAREAGEQATLEVNWRSDQGLIDAYDALFGGARLGHPEIVYRRVRASSDGRPPGVPLRVRVVHRDEPSVRTTPRGYAAVVSAREHVATDLAGDLLALLDSRAPVAGRPVTPGDVAILVQTNRTAADVRDALAHVGIPAVINGAGSVFATALALDWLRLLEALERPTSPARAHAAALTPFLGWSAERIATASEEEFELVHRRLHEWARVLRLKGVASLLETITLLEGLPERVLCAPDGERRMTDLRHVGQLLHGAATAEGLGTAALVAWLRRRIAEAEQDTADEDRSRRLESDAAAVQVLTIHRSKGLEFPIVYYPFLWEPGYVPETGPVVFHDPDGGDVRTVDVGLEGPDFERHQRQHLVERRGEDLRLAYVALTRARHQAVVWWAGSFASRDSALGRLLFARQADGTIAPEGSRRPSDAEVWARLEELAAAAPGCVSVERSRLVPSGWWSGPPRAPAELRAARFERELDWRWRRTSFSDITAGVGEARVASEPEEGLLADEPEPVAVSVGPGDGVPSLLADMPAGARVGTFVHEVFEAADFAASDLDAELATRMAEVGARRPVEIGDPAMVAAGLRAAIETPLGSPAATTRVDTASAARSSVADTAAFRLRDLARADRLDELAFELPLVGGDEPTGRLVLDAIGGVLREHLPAGDPLAGYAGRLADPALRPSVRGFLTGTIDLVARVGARFTVVDYKTNWLGSPGDDLTTWHYRPAALAVEMQRAHYGLQALLYVVALHRYLRWRLPGYEADRDLGGVLYLFLRGMTGAEGGASGVFRWHPPGALVVALSDVLDRGR